MSEPIVHTHKHPLEGSVYRTEHDTFGEIQVPATALWGAQTQRSREHFCIGTSIEIMPYDVIESLAILKKAAARVNSRVGILEKEKAALIEQAADEIISGELQEHFPLVIYQTGSGTQTNMNVNEVIANRCAQLHGNNLGDFSYIHPNDHVNKAQSSNDCFPTAMHIAATRSLIHGLIPALKYMKQEFQKKITEFGDVIKIGRTHCQDATPLTVGQELSAYVTMLDYAIERVSSPLPRLQMLAQGGTAVGTGLNTFEGFDKLVAAEIAELTGIPFVTAPNKFEALSAHDALNELCGQLTTVAGSLHKIANDLRLLGSGPRAGLGEYILPENEPGSSIMPGKVNPTQCEMMTMVCSRIIGNSAQVAFAASMGQFQLNVYKPCIISATLQSLQLLTDGCISFTRHCIHGMKINVQNVKELVLKSLMLVTALNPKIGYEKAAKVAKYAHQNGLTLEESAVNHWKFLTKEEFVQQVDARNMVKPYKLEN